MICRFKMNDWSIIGATFILDDLVFVLIRLSPPEAFVQQMESLNATEIEVTCKCKLLSCCLFVCQMSHGIRMELIQISSCLFINVMIWGYQELSTVLRISYNHYIIEVVMVIVIWHCCWHHFCHCCCLLLVVRLMSKCKRIYEIFYFWQPPMNLFQLGQRLWS